MQQHETALTQPSSKRMPTGYHSPLRTLLVRVFSVLIIGGSLALSPTTGHSELNGDIAAKLLPFLLITMDDDAAANQAQWPSPAAPTAG